MSPPTYLKQRKLGWYVQLPVPRYLHESMGCKVLTRSLRTRDLGEAQRLRHRVIAELQALIEAAAASSPELTPEALLESASRARAAVEAGEVDRRDAEPAFAAAVDDFLEAQARRLGVDSSGHPRLPAAAVETLSRAQRTLTGNPALTLGYQAERYMAAVAASALTRQTVGDKQRHLDSFLDWIGRDTECKRVTKARASVYVDEVVTPRKLAQQTKRVAVNAVRQFFDWMESRDAVALNPFAKAGKLLRDSKRGKEAPRREWQNEELLAMFNHIPQSDPMWPFLALGAYTGARRDDICNLRVDSVDGDVLTIREGKTAAAVRRVPVHPVIRPMVERLVKTSPDGYLLPGLLTGGSDAKRGHYIGKRFSYAKRKAKVNDPRVVFHSCRHSVLTQMEAAGVALSLRQQIAGHERSTVTEVVYTALASDSRRAAALAHVTYGTAVDDLVRTVGASLSLAHVSRRRKAGEGASRPARKAAPKRKEPR